MLASVLSRAARGARAGAASSAAQASPSLRAIATPLDASAAASSSSSSRALHASTGLRQSDAVAPGGGDDSGRGAPRRGDGPPPRRFGGGGGRGEQRSGGGGGGGAPGGGGGARGGPGGGGAFARMGQRVGRPFLDPKASRKLDAVRQDPKHEQWGGMVDVIEHAAYCDGQREEDPDGFFFDNTRPEYDSDCDGDPFSNGYLTEDEYEFPEEYKPTPYIPARIMDQAHFLHTAKGWSLARLAAKYSVAPDRLSALINFKATEAPYKAAGAYDERIDQQMEDLYRGRFGARAGTDYGRVDWETGPRAALLPDSRTPDEAMPRHPRAGNMGKLRIGSIPSPVAPPARADRALKSKFVIRDVSGVRGRRAEGVNPALTSDYSGALRLASNKEVLHRSWTPRYWAVEKLKSANGLPYAEEDEDKPAGFRLPP
jgi:hypothetical protein